MIVKFVVTHFERGGSTCLWQRKRKKTCNTTILFGKKSDVKKTGKAATVI